MGDATRHGQLVAPLHELAPISRPLLTVPAVLLLTALARYMTELVSASPNPVLDRATLRVLKEVPADEVVTGRMVLLK